jgi:hypothetical protein
MRVVPVPTVTEAVPTAKCEVVLLGEPATNVMVAVSLPVPMLAVTVSLCALVEVTFAVKTPNGLVLPELGVNVVFVPVAVKLTVWPLTAFPCPSFTVVVTLALPLALSELGLTTTDDSVRLGDPATNITFAFSVTAPSVAVIRSGRVSGQRGKRVARP